MRDAALVHVVPAIARRVSSNPDAYIYLAESVCAWLPRSELARLVADAGCTDVAWRDLAFGAVALHRAQVPTC